MTDVDAGNRELPSSFRRQQSRHNQTRKSPQRSRTRTPHLRARRHRLLRSRVRTKPKLGRSLAAANEDPRSAAANVPSRAPLRSEIDRDEQGRSHPRGLATAVALLPTLGSAPRNTRRRVRVKQKASSDVTLTWSLPGRPVGRLLEPGRSTCEGAGTA